MAKFKYLKFIKLIYFLQVDEKNLASYKLGWLVSSLKRYSVHQKLTCIHESKKHQRFQLQFNIKILHVLFRKKNYINYTKIFL